MATGMNAAMASMMNNPAMLAMMQQMMQGMNPAQGNMNGYAAMPQAQMPPQNYNGFGQQMTGGYNAGMMPQGYNQMPQGYGQMMAQPTQPRTPGIFDLMSSLPGVFGTALSSDPVLGPVLAQSAGRQYVNSLADHPIMQSVVGNDVLALAYTEMFGKKQQQQANPYQAQYQQYQQPQLPTSNPLLSASNPFVADMMQNQIKQQQAMLQQQQQLMMQNYQQQQVASMANNPYFAAASTTMNPFMAAALLGNQYYDPITKQSMTGTAGGVDDKNQAMMKLLLQQLMSGNLPTTANSTTKPASATKPATTAKKPAPKPATTPKPAAPKPAVDDLLAKITDLIGGLTDQLGA